MTQYAKSIPLGMVNPQADTLSAAGKWLLLVVLVLLLPQGLAAQPVQVTDAFSSPVATPFDLEVFPHDDTTDLCFAGDTKYDGIELLCARGQTLRRVDDIEFGPQGSGPRELTTYDPLFSGNNLYFAADREDVGIELFVYTGAAVELVEDIYPGFVVSDPTNFTVFDDGTRDELFFSAKSPNYGRELFSYDGSTVELVTDVNSGTPSSYPHALIVYDDGKASGKDLYFTAEGRGDGQELYRYDGTNVTLVKDINSGNDGSNVQHPAVYEGTLYFGAQNGSSGQELFAYDESGVRLVEDVISGSDGLSPTHLAVYDDGTDSKLYFRGDNGSDGFELMSYDGREIRLAADINSGADRGDPRHLTVYNDGSGKKLYFRAENGSDGEELFRFDGSKAEQVADIVPGASSSRPENFTVYNDGTGKKLFFTALTGDNERVLHHYDGSTVSQALYDKNLTAGPGPKIIFNRRILMTGSTRSSGNELYEYDGGVDKSGGSLRLVDDLNSGPGDASPSDFAIYDDGSGANLYFAATDGADGRELFRYDGSSITQVADINGGPAGSNPQGLTVYDDGSGAKLYFGGTDGTLGAQLFSYDGTGVTVEDVVNPGGEGSPIRDLTVYENGSGATLYFSASNASVGRELFAFDGTDAQVASDIASGGEGSGVSDLTVYDSGPGPKLYMTATTSSTGRELFVYDGSSTTIAADIASGSENSSPEHLTVFNPGSGSMLGFEAWDPSDGRELFVYDGSTAQKVTDINSGSADSHLDDLMSFKEQLYFTARDSARGREPYAYDGTTVTSRDIAPGSASGGGTDPVRYDDGGASGTDLYVTASVGQSGLELFRFDETTAPLPVDLTALHGTNTETGVQLTWRTASETNNAGFRVQRRSGVNAGTWQTVGFVDGSGTTSSVRRYQFTDADLPYAADTLAYRLRQVDTDGSTQITDPVLVARADVKQMELRETFPNPAHNRVTVRYAVPDGTEAADVTIRLYDVLGRRVHEVVGEAEAGRHERQLQVRDLSSGVYFLRMTADGETETRRLTIVR